jgi:hypothetical protein
MGGNILNDGGFCYYQNTVDACLIGWTPYHVGYGVHTGSIDWDPQLDVCYDAEKYGCANDLKVDVGNPPDVTPPSGGPVYNTPSPCILSRTCEGP